MPGEIRNGMMVRKIIIGCLLPLLVMVSGCTQATSSESSAVNISGINHVAGQTVNSFTVNGYGGTLTGNRCCIMIPDKWRPGLKVHIEWEVDPQTSLLPPGYDDWGNYLIWEQKLKSSFKHFSINIELPQYDQACGLVVHFLPCHQVKASTSCSGYGQPDYPIQEPLNMKEPATCPVK